MERGGKARPPETAAGPDLTLPKASDAHAAAPGGRGGIAHGGGANAAAHGAETASKAAPIAPIVRKLPLKLKLPLQWEQP
jgi:hypothetical protein